jgi:hypothetical protein
MQNSLGKWKNILGSGTQGESDKMKKIAVCISGQLRHFNIFSQLFEYWGTLYDDIEFDFFLSTWNDTDDDLSKYNFLTKYQLLDYDEIPRYLDKWKEHCDTFVPYSYAFYKVHELRRSVATWYKRISVPSMNIQAVQTMPSYDCVIQTRPDMFVPKITLNKIREDVISEKRIVPFVIFTYQGSSIHPSSNVITAVDDNFSYGHPVVMDKLSYMYHDFILGKNEGGVHNGLAIQLVNNKITNIDYGDGCIQPRILRDNPVEKSGHPISKWLSDTIDRQGVKFLFDKTDTQKLWIEFIKEWKWDSNLSSIERKKIWLEPKKKSWTL